jgi:predicted ATPase
VKPFVHRGAFGSGPYVERVALRPDVAPRWGEYPFLPVVRALGALDLAAGVSFLAGENGTGKSTLLEAVAVALGFDLQGGPLRQTPTTRARPGTPGLAGAIDLVLGARKPRSAFFLRAESFFNVAGGLDAQDLSEIYGGRDLLAQSHGEGFLALATNRFGADGLFLLDEPEAALSVTSQLALLDVMRRSVGAGSQYIIATHSPILLCFPGARVFEASEAGLERVAADDTDAVGLTRGFMQSPERYLHHLFGASKTPAAPERGDRRF